MPSPSLSHFLSLTKANIRVFDLSAQLKKMPSKTLEGLDQGKPYPFPYLGYAWLSLFIWNPENSAQHSFWFLKLPLDEQGIVSSGVHNDLVTRLYKALQTDNPEERQRLISDHPYQFTPDTLKMAALHANATKILGLPPSNYYQAAKDYFLHGADVNWQNIGRQGVADLACRLTEKEVSILNARIAMLDEAPLIGLVQQLAHAELKTSTVELLLKQAATTANDELFIACLTAIAGSPAQALAHPLIKEKSSAQRLTLEALLVVVTRFSSILNEETCAIQILDQLAHQSDQDGFNRVMANLAMQPNHRGFVQQLLASQQLTEGLANKIARLIQQQRRSHIH